VARALLPTDLFDNLAFYLGINSSMEEFKGGKNEKKRSKKMNKGV